MRIQLVKDHVSNRFELFDADTRKFLTYTKTESEARSIAARILEAGVTKTTLEVINGQ